jgi:hypothetical protein
MRGSLRSIDYHWSRGSGEHLTLGLYDGSLRAFEVMLHCS